MLTETEQAPTSTEDYSMRYYFKDIEACNMCGSPTAKHKVMGRRLNGSQGATPWKKHGITTCIARCSDCGLIYSTPQPIPMDIQDHYGVPAEDYWKPEYFTLQEDHFSGELEVLRRLLDVKPGMRSLDVGAGLGKQMISLNKAGFDAYGFEPSASFHAKAIAEMGIDPSRLTLGMIEDVDYPDAHFDFISFQVVLEHLYDPAACLDRAMKWLKPGGILHIEVPSSNWLIAKIWNFVYRLQMSEFVSNLSPMHTPYHLHEFSLGAFEAYAKQRNSSIVHHEYYVCETYVPKVLDPLFKKVMAATNTGMEICVWLKK